METSEKDWDKLKRTMCDIIRSYLIYDIKYHVITETSGKKIWEILESKYLTKNIKNRLYLKRRLHRFQLKNRISIYKHKINYTKLLVDLTNVDEVIKDEDKMLILLSSLLDEEYETCILTLINGKYSLCYNDALAALVNHEERRKDKAFSSRSTTVEVLTARGIDSNYRKGKGDIGKSKIDNRELRKNQCVFCKED